jgi:hypothetical protein
VICRSAESPPQSTGRSRKPRRLRGDTETFLRRFGTWPKKTREALPNGGRREGHRRIRNRPRKKALREGPNESARHARPSAWHQRGAHQHMRRMPPPLAVCSPSRLSVRSLRASAFKEANAGTNTSGGEKDRATPSTETPGSRRRSNASHTRSRV